MKILLAASPARAARATHLFARHELMHFRAHFMLNGLILCLMQFNMHAIIAMQLSVSVSAVQPVAKNSPDGENFMVLTSARCFRSTAFSTKPSAVVSCTSMVGRVLNFLKII